MTHYAVETFSADEREVLRHYVTNLDGPVYALVNLPEVVCGALFARYSRSAKSVRRLFLDERAQRGIGQLQTVQLFAATLARTHVIFHRVFLSPGHFAEKITFQIHR